MPPKKNNNIRRKKSKKKFNHKGGTDEDNLNSILKKIEQTELQQARSRSIRNAPVSSTRTSSRRRPPIPNALKQRQRQEALVAAAAMSSTVVSSRPRNTSVAPASRPRNTPAASVAPASRPRNTPAASAAPAPRPRNTPAASAAPASRSRNTPAASAAPASRSRNTAAASSRRRNTIAQQNNAIDLNTYIRMGESLEKQDPFIDPVTPEHYRGVITHEAYMYLCPWCKNGNYTIKNELNCKIFRCGFINRPHLRENQARIEKEKERNGERSKIHGCCGPFEVVVNNSTNQIYTIKRDWNS